MSARLRLLLSLAMLCFAAGCVSTTDELGGVAGLPPLDRSVFVTGGAFLTPSASAGTFVASGEVVDSDEAIPFASIVDVLRRGAVFRRVESEVEPARRRGVRDLLRLAGAPAAASELAETLQRARAEGFDLLLLVEELQDAPIERQGTNGRWPVTFATWILLGVGALIPDRTFESRATLRVSLRDLQTGAVLQDLLLVPGPSELALIERTDLWGLLLSIVVPPFFVGDDDEAVAQSVRATTERRLLLSLARDLKGEAVRRRLDEGGAASLALVPGPAGPRVVVESRESLSVVRLSTGGPLDAAAAAAFEQQMLASRGSVGGRFRYEAPLPDGARRGLVQVLVGTLGGGVASATFAPEELR